MKPFENIGGMRVTVSPHATEEYTLFPDRKRTKRGMRRLRARYGTLKRRRPCAFQTPMGLVVHPDIYRELLRQTGDTP